MQVGCGDVTDGLGAGGWSFTPQVAAVFVDHVRASVPLYDEVQQLAAEVGDWALPAGGVFADLGASTGQTARALFIHRAGRAFTSHLYDESASMLAQARQALADVPSVRTYCQRVEDPLQHHSADLTTALWTLQFMRPAARAAALRGARERSSAGGMLIVAEKVRPADSRWADIAGQRSHDWKAAHGIGAEAIRSKARSLRGVLVAQSVDTVRAEVEAAGWDSVEMLLAWHSWVVLGAWA